MTGPAVGLGGKVALKRPRVEFGPGGAVLDKGAPLPAVDELAAIGREGLQTAVVVTRAERRRGGGGAPDPAAGLRLPLRLGDGNL